jgi:hypothetical protein
MVVSGRTSWTLFHSTKDRISPLNTKILRVLYPHERCFSKVGSTIAINDGTRVILDILYAYEKLAKCKGNECLTKKNKGLVCNDLNKSGRASDYLFVTMITY